MSLTQHWSRPMPSDHLRTIGKCNPYAGVLVAVGITVGVTVNRGVLVGTAVFVSVGVASGVLV